MVDYYRLEYWIHDLAIRLYEKASFYLNDKTLKNGHAVKINPNELENKNSTDFKLHVCPFILENNYPTLNPKRIFASYFFTIQTLPLQI